MYAKCGSTEDAWKVFNETPMRNMVCWSAMIVGYVRCGQGQKALELSQQMHQDGVEPDSMTFVGILNACGSVAALDKGRCVHKQIVQNGCKLDVYVVSSLIDMYAKCGSIEDAQRVFNRMSTHDVISWSAMISGYVTCGKGQEALELYQEMQQKGVERDHVTFLAVQQCLCQFSCT
jgi:pentatricopeptide repeat protein